MICLNAEYRGSVLLQLELIEIGHLHCAEHLTQKFQGLETLSRASGLNVGDQRSKYEERPGN